ncbi:hypothetical protein ACP70R_041086 [Stipagrostis hirtigluma subsp. patula]
MKDTMNAGSSTGWTDEKHMRYITSLEESFVNQLYSGDVNSKGLFCRSLDGYWGMLEADGTGSRSSKAEYVGSPSCYGYLESSIACYMDDDTSTNGPQQVRAGDHARSKNSGTSDASYLQWHGRFLSRRTGQNFIDGDLNAAATKAEGVEESD